jgi:hypothetical protein
MGGLLFAHGSTCYTKEPPNGERGGAWVASDDRPHPPAGATPSVGGPRASQPKFHLHLHAAACPTGGRRCLSCFARMHCTSSLFFFFFCNKVVPCHANRQWATTRAGSSSRVTLSGTIWDATSREIQSSRDEEKTQIV